MSTRKLTIKNYYKKRIIQFLFNEKGYNNVKLLKIISDFYLKIPYELSPILKFLINPGDVVFDIGANMGQYACRLNNLVGSKGKIYSFEPVELNFVALKKMKTLLNLSNVEILQLGIHIENGYSLINIPIFNNGLIVGTQATLENLEYTKFKSERIETQTLDSFIINRKILKLDFIKCDTEGNEVNVLKGGIKTIEKFLPTMSLEINYSNEYLKNIFRLGYLAFIFDKKIKKIKKINHNQIGNLILIHRTKIKDIECIIEDEAANSR